MERQINVYYDIDVENAEAGVYGILTITEKDYFDTVGYVSDGGSANYDKLSDTLDSINCENACDSTHDMYIDEATMIAKMKTLGFNMIKSEAFTNFLNKH